MKAKIRCDWIIHAIVNGEKCAISGRTIDSMIEGSANIHTHGLEKYGHKDFQLVLPYERKTYGYILNTLGMRVKNGERFKHGDYVKGIFEDCDVRLETFEESGRDVLRVIVPDENNIFPDESDCNLDYRVQLLETEQLYRIKYY